MSFEPAGDVTDRGDGDGDFEGIILISEGSSGKKKKKSKKEMGVTIRAMRSSLLKHVEQL